MDIFSKNLAVYECGGLAKRKLWNDYKTCMLIANRDFFSKHSFEELMDIMTKKGNSKI